MNKEAIMLAYVKEKCKKVNIELKEETVGLVDNDQWVILGKHQDIADRLLIVVNMQTPRKIIVLPITDTLAYFSAKYILAYHNNARNLANRLAEEQKEEK